jgi:hypothetical protein
MRHVRGEGEGEGGPGNSANNSQCSLSSTYYLRDDIIHERVDLSEPRLSAWRRCCDAVVLQLPILFYKMMTICSTKSKTAGARIWKGTAEILNSCGYKIFVSVTQGRYEKSNDHLVHHNHKIHRHMDLRLTSIRNMKSPSDPPNPATAMR